MREMNTGERGWAMIELVMVVLLLGIICSISYPAFAVLGERIERQFFLKVLASELSLAQTEAVSRETEVVVALDRVHRLVTVSQAEQRDRTLRVPQRYQIISNYPGDRIIFRETGQVRGGTITLFEGEKALGNIVIHVASGHPKVEWVP